MWTVPLQPTSGALDALFSFSVEPCDQFFPDGAIVLVIQQEGYYIVVALYGFNIKFHRFHATPLSGSDPFKLGIPNAFVVIVQLKNTNTSTVTVANTDCTGNAVVTSGNVFDTTGIITLYTINTVSIEERNDMSGQFCIHKLQ